VLRSDEDPSIRGFALTVRFNCGLVISHVILIAVLPAPAMRLACPFVQAGGEIHEKHWIYICCVISLHEM
jgi:hypothetical protein